MYFVRTLGRWFRLLWAGRGLGLWDSVPDRLAETRLLALFPPVPAAAAAAVGGGQPQHGGAKASNPSGCLVILRSPGRGKLPCALCGTGERMDTSDDNSGNRINRINRNNPR